jgi:hypothetical protein
MPSSEGDLLEVNLNATCSEKINVIYKNKRPPAARVPDPTDRFVEVTFWGISATLSGKIKKCQTDLAGIDLTTP